MSVLFRNIKISFLTLLIRFLYGSCHWQVSGFNHAKNLLNTKSSFIIAFWHGNLLIPYYKLAKHHFNALAGFHRDAELSVQIGVRLGWKFLRGSSSQKGSEVFKQMVDYLSEPGNVLAITPDGPKGPAKISKPGAVRIAQKIGIPIIPAAGCSRRSWGFTNWDTFYITKPFTRIDLKFGEPIYFSINDDFNSCLDTLKTKLDSLEEAVSKSVKGN